MPRLSVIVPSTSDEASLERTLVSVLESRDRGIEVLLPHADSYRDPYGLDGDEVRLLTVRGDATATELINCGIEAASADIVQVLLPGASVRAGWCGAVLSAFSDPRVAAVAAAVDEGCRGQAAIGLRGSQLPRRQGVSPVETAEHAFPFLCGGYYRRGLLQSLGGLMGELPLAVAEVELALALQTLAVTILRYAEPAVATEVPLEPSLGYQEGQALGRVTAAYAAHEASPIQIDGLSVRMGRLAAGLFHPASIAHRLGWTLGLQDRSLLQVVRGRIASASEAWQAHLDAAEATAYRVSRRAA